MQIQIHSMTDLITNSSTVIYTWSDASPAALYEMINEIFRVFGVNKTCEDVFTVTVLCDDYEYLDAEDIPPEAPEEFRANNNNRAALKRLLAGIKDGSIEKPAWLSKMEREENDMGWRPSTRLFITPKHPECAKLADLVEKFLYSTEHDGSREG